MYFRKVLCILLLMSLLITACSIPLDHGLEKDDKKEDQLVENENNTEENVEKEEEPMDHIRLKIEGMSLEEKIGQLVLVGMEGYEVNSNIRELIHNYYVGGIIVYKKNIQNSNQLVSLINSLKTSNSQNKIPLFISVDEEGGAVSRLPDEIKKLPTARSIGRTGNSDLALEVGKTLGETVKALGYNMNFAPVLDIDSNPLNPVIGNRSFGETVGLVSDMGIGVLKGIKEEGVIPVVKHFPGHGDTSVDSHIGLPVIDHDIERIRSFEMVPFKNAIDQGADVVMVAHILMAEIDSKYPSSMSHIMISDLLRKELGFSGVVITDDMTMGAIEKNYNLEDATIQAIKAGADIVLVGHGFEKAVAVINAIKESVENQNISMERIDESVYRILKLKQEYELEDLPVEVLDIEGINEKIIHLIDKIKLEETR